MIMLPQSSRSDSLPSWIRALLASPPAAGDGIHRWLYRCACALRGSCAAADSTRLLKAATERCGRTVTERELADAVRNARAEPWRPRGISPGLRVMLGNGSDVEPPRAGIGWPPPDWSTIAAIARTGVGIPEMLKASPEQLSDRHTAAFMLDALFPGQPLLCLAREHPADAYTAPRASWPEPHRFGLMVPSPMRARMGKRKDGQPSRRCLDNVGPRRFLVVEFDFSAGRGGVATPAAPILATLAAETPPRTAPDVCAAVLLHLLKQGAPLVLAVHSGGKSVHGWFPAVGTPEAELRRFFACACRLGADPATWTACQLVRLPGGTRSNGAPQRILYFNPHLIPAQ
jgi:hypothetical protein